MSELALVVRAEFRPGVGFEHRDTESLVERSYQPEPSEFHIGFRAD